VPTYASIQMSRELSYPVYLAVGVRAGAPVHCHDAPGLDQEHMNNPWNKDALYKKPQKVDNNFQLK
jgi:hypothetical protein